MVATETRQWRPMELTSPPIWCQSRNQFKWQIFQKADRFTKKKFVLVKLECFFESVQVKIEWKSISDFLWFHWTMSASGAKNILVIVYSLNFSSIQFGSYLHQLRRTCLTLFAHVHVLKLLSVNLENVTSFMVDQPS